MSVSDRPDWVPSWWSANRVNRWTWARPSRMLTFYAVMTTVAVAFLAWAAIWPDAFFDGPRAYTCVAAMVVWLAFAVVWVPRAVRAWRRERRDATAGGYPPDSR
jgi:hypothetical protein